MSTPFPPNSKMKGPAIYAPQRVRDRLFPQDPAEIADASAQVEPAEPFDCERIEREPTATADDASHLNDAEAEKPPLASLDDAIRAVLELKHASDNHVQAEPSVSALPITARHDESDLWQQDRIEPRNAHPPRLDTQIPPPAPPLTRDSGQFGQILRLSLAIMFAAIVAYGVTRFYQSGRDTPQLDGPSDRIVEASSRQTKTQAAPQTPSRLIVEDQQAFANEPVALAINVEHATDNESLLVDGLAQGTTLSAGTTMSASSWQLAPDKLSGLYLYAPKGFVGVMNTIVKLLDPDKRLLDSRAMRLKWISKPPQEAPLPTVASAGNEGPAAVRINPALPDAPAVRSIDPPEAAMLMQRGRDFLATGDISAARVAFRRLADAGMPDAALALANTYDPAYLTAHNVVGVSGDPVLAQRLYQRAKDLGSVEGVRIPARIGAN